jgi:hypothetical protein
VYILAVTYIRVIAATAVVTAVTCCGRLLSRRMSHVLEQLPAHARMCGVPCTLCAARCVGQAARGFQVSRGGGRGTKKRVRMRLRTAYTAYCVLLGTGTAYCVLRKALQLRT